MPDDAHQPATDPDLAIAPREAWYAALASQRLGEAPVAARVLDHDIALWRDQSGRANAVENRCTHRGAQLSLGDVTAGAIACRYHGWRYGGDGACVHIPSLLDGQSIPRGIAVRAFPCVERDGYVWLWAGDGAPTLPGPEPIAAFDRFDWLQGALTLQASALSVIENNLDWCHPVFAHPNTHGQYFLNQALGFREYAIEMRLTDRGVVVFSPVVGPADPIPPDPQVSLEYELPDRVTVAFAGPQGLVRIVIHAVPVGPGACRQEWMISTGPAESGRGPAVRWSDEPSPIFEQDRVVLESVQLAAAREGRRFERSVEADAPMLLARRVYAAAAQGHWPAARAGLTARRILRVRT